MATTEFDIFVKKLNFRGVVKMKILNIGFMSFLTIQMNLPYQKTYIWIKIWLKSVNSSQRYWIFIISPIFAHKKYKVNSSAHIMKTVNFRALVLLALLIYVIKPTIQNGQTHCKKFLIFFQIRKNAPGSDRTPDGMLTFLFLAKKVKPRWKFWFHQIKADKICDKLKNLE